METKLTTVNGFKMIGMNLNHERITVRFTSDKTGKTLSLASEGTLKDSVMLVVPFEQIESMIKGE